jgi:hypothetical protein
VNSIVDAQQVGHDTDHGQGGQGHGVHIEPLVPVSLLMLQHIVLNGVKVSQAEDTCSILVVMLPSSSNRRNSFKSEIFWVKASKRVTQSPYGQWYVVCSTPWYLRIDRSSTGHFEWKPTSDTQIVFQTIADAVKHLCHLQQVYDSGNVVFVGRLQDGSGPAQFHQASSNTTSDNSS